MSANNFIHIEEVSPEKFSVIEKDYESYVKIQTIGFFHSMKLAIRKAEEHIKNHEYEVEYGIRFSLKEEDITNKDFDVWNVKKKCAEKEKSIQGKKASAILSQIRVVDTRRLVEKIGFLDKEIFKQLRKTARSLF